MIRISIPNNNIQERKYILNIIFDEFLGLDFKALENNDYQDWIIEFGNKEVLTIKDTFFSKYPKELEYLKLENIPEKIEELDIFAASFFMLTRWEEYVNKNRDSHNRFPATESLAFKQGFLDRPVVNEYVEELRSKLLDLDSNLEFKKREYQLFLTHDVDVPLKYRALKSGIREIAGDIIKRKNIRLAIKNSLQVAKVTLGLQKDPFDTFDYLMDVSEQAEVKSYFFFMAKGLTKFDNMYKSDDKFIIELVKNIKQRGHHIGFHPTYNAYNNKEQLIKEKRELEKNLDTNITFGREHYLRFEVPTTWQIWEDENILFDSTLGYADRPGFRCGICYEFSVFNILTQEKLKLKERPLIAMECSLFEERYLNLSYKESYEKLISLLYTVKKYNGNFTWLWHNDQLSNQDKRELYEKVLKDCVK